MDKEVKRMTQARWCMNTQLVNKVQQCGKADTQTAILVGKISNTILKRFLEPEGRLSWRNPMEVDLEFNRTRCC